MSVRFVLLTVLIGLLAHACSFGPLASWQPAPPTIAPLPMAQVRYWAYQIQALADPGAVDQRANSRYDLLVLDPTRTDWSSNEKAFDTKAMVDKLKNALASDGAHRKLVIAYIDIGEAENWCWYWQWSKDWPQGRPRPADWPDYILTRDPDGWSGNFPVAYWDPRWKDIIIYGQNQTSSPDENYNSVIDETIKNGFDGIYLDWVEGFEDSLVAAEAHRQGKDPAVEMINFIQEMKDYAAQRMPNFIIIQQNGAGLADGHPEIFSKVQAIAQEEVWCDGDADVDWNDPRGYDQMVSSDLTIERIANLSCYKAAKVPVFNVEYAVSYACDAYSKSYSQGFVPYVSRRALSALTTTPPLGLGGVCS